MPKRIVICSDGTWSRPDQKERGKEVPTNVVKFARALKQQASDGTQQLVFYNVGVGTGNFWDRFIGGAFGAGLSDKILEAYRFLVFNFNPGDELFFVGFSRGAYSVRSLAGLIRNCGILKKSRADMIDEAYSLYQDRSLEAKPNGAKSVQFRSLYAQETRIKFIGVWDTVGTMGIPIRRLRWVGRSRFDFHDTKLSSRVENAFQAMSIDEYRRPYEAAVWERDKDDCNNVEQVWFSGIHGDVGGGNLHSGLSNIALRWLVSRVSGMLEFDEDYLNAIDPQPENNYTAPIGEADAWIGVLLGRLDRSIGKCRYGNEKVHATAQRRLLERIDDYRPRNLIKALEKGIKVID